MSFTRSADRPRLWPLLFVAACSKQEAPQQPPPPEVGVVVVHCQPVPLVREASGRLAPTRASDVRARVPGVLQKRLYKEGSMVKEGDPLVIIDTAPYRAALAQATAHARAGRSLRHQRQGHREPQSRAREAEPGVAHAARRRRSARALHAPRRCPRRARRCRPRASTSATPPSPRRSPAAPASCACSKARWSGRARRRC